MSNLPFIVCLNGPPGCGKDSLGLQLGTELEHIQHKLPWKLEKFAQPIRDAAIATFPHVNEWNFEELKDKQIFFNGPTLREWMISFSENLMKPLLGPHIFGELLSTRIDATTVPSFHIVTDCGFKDEVLPLVDAFKPERMILFNIHRKGHTFDGDSRSYIDLATDGLVGHRVDNWEGCLGEVVERQILPNLLMHINATDKKDS